MACDPIQSRGHGALGILGAAEAADHGLTLALSAAAEALAIAAAAARVARARAGANAARPTHGRTGAQGIDAEAAQATEVGSGAGHAAAGFDEGRIVVIDFLGLLHLGSFQLRQRFGVEHRGLDGRFAQLEAVEFRLGECRFDFGLEFRRFHDLLGHVHRAQNQSQNDEHDQVPGDAGGPKRADHRNPVLDGARGSITGGHTDPHA